MKTQKNIDVEEFHARLSPAEMREIRRKIQEGFDDLKAGRYTACEGREDLDNFMSEIKARGRARLKETRARKQK